MGEGEARGKEGGRGRENDYSQLSCQNKHVISPCGKVKCRWTPSISGDCSQPPHTALSGLGRTPSGCPSDFKYKRLQGGFHVSSHRRGFRIQGLKSVRRRKPRVCAPKASQAMFGSLLRRSRILEAQLWSQTVPWDIKGQERREKSVLLPLRLRSWWSWNLQDRGLLILSERQPRSKLAFSTHFLKINFLFRRQYHNNLKEINLKGKSLTNSVLACSTLCVHFP